MPPTAAHPSSPQRQQDVPLFNPRGVKVLLGSRVPPTSPQAPEIMDLFFVLFYGNDYPGDHYTSHRIKDNTKKELQLGLLSSANRRGATYPAFS